MLKLFVRGVKQGYATNSSSYHNTVMWSSEDEDALKSGEKVLLYDMNYPTEYFVLDKDDFEERYKLDPEQEDIYIENSDKWPIEYKKGTYLDVVEAMEDDDYGEVSHDSITLSNGVTVCCVALYGRDG